MILSLHQLCHARISRLARLSLFASVLIAPSMAWSQDTAPAKDEPKAGESDVSPEQFKEAEMLFKGAFKAYSAEDYEKSLEMLDKLQALVPKNSAAINLKGAILTKQGKFDEALAVFQKASELAPNDSRPKFNIAEISFLQKKYAEAREGFSPLADKKNRDLAELAAYKIYLTYLLEGNNAMAEQTLKGFDEFSSMPTYYFAQAAKAFHAGNVQEGQDWIISARKIYPGNRNSLYAETMMDLDWITKEHFDRIKVTAREAVIDYKQPLRVPKQIAKDLNMMPKKQPGGGRKKLNDPTAVKSKPFNAPKAKVDLGEEE